MSQIDIDWNSKWLISDLEILECISKYTMDKELLRCAIGDDSILNDFYNKKVEELKPLFREICEMECR